MMDKFAGLPPIYYINLDEEPNRAESLENQFKEFEIENFTRISAHDGRGDDLSDIIKGRYPSMMNSGEVGCVTSHLKCLKHFLENSDDPCVLVMEDDCDLDTVKHWSFSWKDFYSKIPFSFFVNKKIFSSTTKPSNMLHKS